MINVTEGNVVPLRVMMSFGGGNFPVVNASDVKVRVRSLWKSHECSFGFDVVDDNVVYVEVPSVLKPGVYGLEVVGKMNGTPWRSYLGSVVEVTRCTQKGVGGSVSSAGDLHDIIMTVDLYKGVDPTVRMLSEQAVADGRYDEDRQVLEFMNMGGQKVFGVCLPGCGGDVFHGEKYYEKGEVDERDHDTLSAMSRAAVFGRFVEDDVDIVEGYLEDSNDENQVCYIVRAGRFAYCRHAYGETSYFSRWKNWEIYSDKFGYPHAGKLYYCADGGRLFLYDRSGVRDVVMEMGVETISRGRVVGTVYAEYDRCYRFDDFVESVTIELPSWERRKVRRETVFLMDGWKECSVAFRSDCDIRYAEDYSVVGGMTAEITCSYYAGVWYVKLRKMRT